MEHFTLITRIVRLYNEICKFVGESLATGETKLCQKEFLLDFWDFSALGRVTVGLCELGYHLCNV